MPFNSAFFRSHAQSIVTVHLPTTTLDCMLRRALIMASKKKPHQAYPTGLIRNIATTASKMSPEAADTFVKIKEMETALATNPYFSKYAPKLDDLKKNWIGS